MKIYNIYSDLISYFLIIFFPSFHLSNLPSDISDLMNIEDEQKEMQGFFWENAMKRKNYPLMVVSILNINLGIW